MNGNKSLILILGIIFLLSACSRPTLNGHYHLIWDKNSEKFQTWNFRNNKMKINEDFSSNPDSSITSIIRFRGNTITVDSWVDVVFTAKYKIDEQGIVTMFSEYDNDTLWLIPHQNCMSAKTYFENKTKHLTDSFNLPPYSYTGINKFPNNFENELIIGHSINGPFYIFNDRSIHRSENEEFGINKVNDETVWVHVDKDISVQTVLPIIKELFEKGYHVHYSTIEEVENNEQIKLMDRTIKNFSLSPNKIEIDYCEFCSKYPVSTLDSIVNIQMLGAGLYIMNGDTTNLFLRGKSLTEYLIQNRTTRLNTQIQIEIDGMTSFSDYLNLLNNLRWAHIVISDILYYRDKNDPDTDRIRELHKNRSNEILYEFPMRIKEIIKITPPNNMYSQ